MAAMVTAQVLTQIGAFTLPALLPGYIERWSLSKTEAGWLVGIFFAASFTAASFFDAMAGLAGIVVPVTGNETAQRYGRSRVVAWAMTAAAAGSLVTGWMTATSVALAALIVLLWNAAIYLDSSALTAGTVQAADKHLRGATMGLHSMAGYAGGFLGPLGVGLVLDAAGGDSVLGWGLAFAHLAVITLAGLWVVHRLGRAQ